MTKLGDFIAGLRAEKGWSQKELARRADLSQATIQKIESGDTKNPKIDILIDLARGFKISVMSLILAYQGKSTDTLQGFDGDIMREELHTAINKVLDKRLPKN